MVGITSWIHIIVPKFMFACGQAARLPPYSLDIDILWGIVSEPSTNSPFVIFPNILHKTNLQWDASRASDPINSLFESLCARRGRQCQFWRTLWGGIHVVNSYAVWLYPHLQYTLIVAWKLRFVSCWKGATRVGFWAEVQWKIDDTQIVATVWKTFEMLRLQVVACG